ncbi:MAG: integrase [Clostridiales bacterium]|nr:integrase [Clostridiales bacterium]
MESNINQLNKLIKQLPPFCSNYFIGISNRTTELTRISYARDLSLFFKFLSEQTEEFAQKSITLKDLDNVTSEQIEQFIYYITYYESSNKTPTGASSEIQRHNGAEAKARKLSAIRSLYKYFIRKKQLTHNPVDFVEMPKRREKAIIKLDPAEVANLLDAVENGYGQSERQKKYNRPKIVRDVAILTLFLGTGIRISELTGIDIDNINQNERAILITRKGQKQDTVYYGDEVSDALEDYLEVRKNMSPLEGHEKALFLSGQRKRITNRAIQNLVKKYAHMITPLKRISPHSLRKTYGTTLYNQTGDIYLVATVLGHKDVNTTKKHYAVQNEENKYMASKAIRLRYKDDNEKDA